MDCAITRVFSRFQDQELEAFGRWVGIGMLLVSSVSRVIYKEHPLSHLKSKPQGEVDRCFAWCFSCRCWSNLQTHLNNRSTGLTTRSARIYDYCISWLANQAPYQWCWKCNAEDVAFFASSSGLETIFISNRPPRHVSVKTQTQQIDRRVTKSVLKIPTPSPTAAKPSC